MTKYKTAESVRRGHPDTLCDLIADTFLDECLNVDKSSRVACEVMATKGKIFVAGEITCSKKIDIRWVVNGVLKKVGYWAGNWRISWSTGPKGRRYLSVPFILQSRFATNPPACYNYNT